MIVCKITPRQSNALKLKTLARNNAKTSRLYAWRMCASIEAYYCSIRAIEKANNAKFRSHFVPYQLENLEVNSMP